MKKLFSACCAVLLLDHRGRAVRAGRHRSQRADRGEGRNDFRKVDPGRRSKKIEASSDTQERNCDGVNELDPENVAPGVTPTLASAEAMESIGETFDGQWYEGFGDYFITRWGPDEQDNAASAWWGILVNQVFTSVGGCQKQLKQDDEVLWLYDAFSSRPMLALYPGSGALRRRAAADPGHRRAGRTGRRSKSSPGPAGGESIARPKCPRAPAPRPTKGPMVAPVTVNAKGFQRVDAASPEAVDHRRRRQGHLHLHHAGHPPDQGDRAARRGKLGGALERARSLRPGRLRRLRRNRTGRAGRRNAGRVRRRPRPGRRRTAAKSPADVVPRRPAPRDGRPGGHRPGAARVSKPKLRSTGSPRAS